MEASELIQRVLEEGPVTVEELAEDADLSPHTLWAWRRGDRRPRPRSLRRLADALEDRSGELLELAQEIREAAGEG